MINGSLKMKNTDFFSSFSSFLFESITESDESLGFCFTVCERPLAPGDLFQHARDNVELLIL